MLILIIIVQQLIDKSINSFQMNQELKKISQLQNYLQRLGKQTLSALVDNQITVKCQSHLINYDKTTIQWKVYIKKKIYWYVQQKILTNNAEKVIKHVPNFAVTSLIQQNFPTLMFWLMEIFERHR